MRRRVRGSQVYKSPTEYDQQEHFGDVAAMVDAVKGEYGTDFKLLVHEHTLTRSVRTLKVDLEQSAEPSRIVTPELSIAR